MIRKLFRLLGRARDIGADEYEQLSILQRTNMSEVWLARRKADRLITVTKIARVDKPKYAKANQKAILNEAQWLHKLQGNPRIIQIYRTGETTLPGKPRFIAAEYLDGGTVEDLLEQESLLGRINRGLLFFVTFFRRPNDSAARPNVLRFLGIAEHRLYKGPLPVEQALLTIQYMAEGLAHMHKNGVVHRDIKPDNVMFRYRPRHGQTIADDNLVLIDFGITSGHNRTAGAAIARGWSEPRRIQARKERKPIVVHSGFDIYCLGKVLRYLLTHVKPLGKSNAELSEPLNYESLRFNKSLSVEERIDLAHSLSTLIDDCLHPDVEMRPSAKEVIKAIALMLNALNRSRRLLPGSSLRAKPSQSHGKLASTQASDESRTGRRWLRPEYVGAVAIITLGLFISTWIWQYGTAALVNMTSPIAGFIKEPGASGISSAQEANPLQSDRALTVATLVSSSEDVDATLVLSDLATDGTEDVPESMVLEAGPAEKETAPLETTAPSETTAPPETTVPLPTSTAVETQPALDGNDLNNVEPKNDKSEDEATTLKPTATSISTPVVEPSPTRKSRPTNTPVAAPPAQTTNSTGAQAGQQVGNAAPAVPNRPENLTLGPLANVSAKVNPNSNGCRGDSLDTWDEQVEIRWTLEPAGTVLPAEFAQEVVVWRAGADPLDPNQAYTIHGRDEILVSDGSFILQRKPKSLIPDVFRRNEEMIWGIILVNGESGARFRQLTPVDCLFHPAGRLFGDGQGADAGGGQ